MYTPSKEHIRHVLLFEFHKGNTASSAAKTLKDTYGNDVVNEKTCRRWFSRFKKDDFSLKDEPRAGCSKKLNSEQLQAAIDGNPTCTTRELSKTFNVSHMTIYREMKRLGKVSKAGKWVPHELSEINRQQRVTCCVSLRSRELQAPFLDRIITGDEKWILYNNVKRKRQWLSRGSKPIPQPRSGLHPKKILLCVWWDLKGIVYYELMGDNQTITSEVYCQQLTRLKAVLQEKRPSLINRKGVILHHDNARPHTARATKNLIEEFGWEVMHHPPYSPDLAPTDFHLFRSLQNHLMGQRLTSRDEVEMKLVYFFESKLAKFYEEGIRKLMARWEDVINKNGDYVED